MSDKRKKLEFAAKRERRRLKRLADDGLIRNGVEIPRAAILADPSQQVPNNSYSPPPLFYVDKEFVCVDCGRQEEWTAQQQKWYYEVAKGSLYATAVRCRDCRRKHSKQHDVHGDPNPIKHAGSLMKRIRSDIEPCLIEAGFAFDGKNKVTVAGYAWIDYSRSDFILRCLFKSRDARLIAETIDESAAYGIVANVELSGSRSTSALLERVNEFTSSVREYLRSLLMTTDGRDGNDT